MSERNPWLDVPAEDYLGHMGSEAVGQLPVLTGLFADALAALKPRRLLVLGCGTGNGFDRINPRVTRQVTGVEINPAYLEALRRRFPSPSHAMDLLCCDAAEYAIPEAAFDLVYAALLFEYVTWESMVSGIARGVTRTGGVWVVLQLPSPTAPAVSRTDYPSVRVLEPLFRFVDPSELKDAFRRHGLRLEGETQIPLPQGKAFGVYRFRRAAWRPGGEPGSPTLGP